MTNYEKIKTALKHGLHVSVKDGKEYYQIISPMKDKDGDYKMSFWYDNLESAKENIGEVKGHEDLQNQCKNWTEITPFHLDFEPYPEGMKVQVVKTGGVDKIRANGDSIYVLQGTAGCYAHTELFPYYEEEPTEMTIKQIEEKLNITGLKIIK